jgi:hypothetical protein
MKTIWKYPLGDTFPKSIMMPCGAKVLTVQMQGRQLQLWALVDPNQPYEPRRFSVFGTGWESEISGTYIGTFQLDGGSLVFHVFEEPTEGDALVGPEIERASATPLSSDELKKAFGVIPQGPPPLDWAEIAANKAFLDGIANMTVGQDGTAVAADLARFRGIPVVHHPPLDVLPGRQWRRARRTADGRIELVGS